MKKVVVVSLLLFFLQGCSWNTNRENLNNIEVGMNKAQVLEIKGKPYRREAEGRYEWLLYQTRDTSGWRREYLTRTKSDFLTPYLFEDGKLIGWGQNFWKSKEQKYDITIDQRVKQE